MSFTLRNKLGVWGEHEALELYRKHGYQLIAQNVCNPHGKRFGEIDIVVKKRGVIVFIEVKTRQSRNFGNSAEAIHLHKQQRLLKTVKWFLFTYPRFRNFQPRIDVCLITVSEFDSTQKSVIIIPNAVTDET